MDVAAGSTHGRVLEPKASRLQDQAAKAGEGSRADVINRAIKREIRRRAAVRDAQIYASSAASDLESDAYGRWAARNTGQVWSELD